jgi:hypothetical protein
MYCLSLFDFVDVEKECDVVFEKHISPTFSTDNFANGSGRECFEFGDLMERENLKGKIWRNVRNFEEMAKNEKKVWDFGEVAEFG